MTVFPQASNVTNCIGRPMLPSDVSGAMGFIGMSQDRWARRCLVRLLELKPHGGRSALEAVAIDLSDALVGFDPEMAAEMEFESGALDD